MLVSQGRHPQQISVIETAIEQVDGEIQVDIRCQLTILGYGVAVANLSVTRDLLEQAELPVRPAPSGGCFVPATAALGAAVIFRSDHEVEGPR